MCASQIHGGKQDELINRWEEWSGVWKCLCFDRSARSTKSHETSRNASLFRAVSWIVLFRLNQRMAALIETVPLPKNTYRRLLPPSRAWKSNHKVTKNLNRIQAVTNCLSVLVSSCLSG